MSFRFAAAARMRAGVRDQAIGLFDSDPDRVEQDGFFLRAGDQIERARQVVDLQFRDRHGRIRRRHAFRRHHPKAGFRLERLRPAGHAVDIAGDQTNRRVAEGPHARIAQGRPALQNGPPFRRVQPEHVVRRPARAFGDIGKAVGRRPRALRLHVDQQGRRQHRPRRHARQGNPSRHAQLDAPVDLHQRPGRCPQKPGIAHAFLAGGRVDLDDMDALADEGLQQRARRGHVPRSPQRDRVGVGEGDNRRIRAEPLGQIVDRMRAGASGQGRDAPLLDHGKPAFVQDDEDRRLVGLRARTGGRQHQQDRRQGGAQNFPGRRHPTDRRERSAVSSVPSSR